MRTIQDWEDARAVEEIEADLETLETIPTLPSESELGEDFNVLCERSNSGFDVQLGIDNQGRTFVNCTLNGEGDSFEVPNDKALDAFYHPFVYGCNLPL